MQKDVLYDRYHDLIVNTVCVHEYRTTIVTNTRLPKNTNEFNILAYKVSCKYPELMGIVGVLQVRNEYFRRRVRWAQSILLLTGLVSSGLAVFFELENRVGLACAVIAMICFFTINYIRNLGGV